MIFPAPTPEKPAGSAFDGSEQNGTRPFDAAFGFDLLGFFGCEADAEDVGAALVGRQRWASGAWHVMNIAGHRKFRKGVDRGDFCGHNKDMNAAAKTITADNRTYTFTTEDAETRGTLDTLGTLYNSRGNFFGYVVRNNTTGRIVVLRSGRVSPRLDRACQTALEGVSA